ncbi:MAG TPA: D-glycerate dehydrogenase [Tepidiformaceae bacterium]|nr:D-glycerate dehydrogenase [Tepidiformaceae bacterium]
MGKVFVTREVPGRAIDMLRGAGHEVDVWPDALPPPPDVLRERVSSADAVLALLTDRFDEDLLAAAPRLRIIANMAVGYDNVNPAVAAAAGVWVSNTPGVLAETTADFAFALMLAAARQVVASERDTRAGGWKTWSPTAFLGPDVHGATLGIVGLGEIGRQVAKRARGFEMRVLAATRTPREADERDLGVRHVAPDELLAESDFVSLHVPLTPDTRGLFGRDAFHLMKRTAVLVNTARGPVVDQDALVDALRAGEIAGAALDVTDPEPLPLEHPLFSLANVIITPHIASASVATRSRMAEMAASNILAALAGEHPPNALATPESPRR